MYVTQFDIFVFLLIVIIVPFIIFLIIRNFLCWYYKININIHLLENINKNLEFISKQNFPEKYEEYKKTFCSKCGKKIKEKTYFCSACNEYFCYDCILAGKKCPNCNSKVQELY